MRRYIEERFNFIALELTTHEIIEILKTKVREKNSLKIRSILERADLAKFAKSKPVDDENIESMNIAKNFIKLTKEESNSV